MSDFSIKSGSLGPALTATLYDGSTPLPLTGATVAFRMRAAEGGPLVIDNEPATIVGDPVDGRVSYEWQAGDTDTAGLYDAEFVVTFLGGTPQVFPKDDYIVVEIEQSLVSVVLDTMPDLPDYCWPVDETACLDLADFSPSTRVRAKALAAQTLYRLTGYSVGGCPITIRPHRTNCAGLHATSIFNPVNVAGTWTNSACPCGTSEPLNAIALPMPVGRVDSVKIDGVVLDPSAYSVMNDRYLIRADGTAWPVTQDVTKPDTEVGTFSITYLRGRPVDGLGAKVAGVLACEFAKAIENKKCALPPGVTEIVRQGVSMRINSGAFPDGLTGIREVDVFITAYNPHALAQEPVIVSPDRPGPWVQS